jgi:hypothetical protein
LLDVKAAREMRVLIVVAILVVTASSDSLAQSNRDVSATAAVTNQSKNIRKSNQTSISSKSISSAVADMFVGLVSEINLHPDRNVVELFAKGFGWKETSLEINAMLNAKRGFSGKVAGQILLLGSDGTNDIFSIAIGNNFDQKIFHGRLGETLTLKPVASDTSMGQRMDIYRIFDGPKYLGLLTVTYGVVEAVRGTGTVGFISAARAKREGIGYNKRSFLQL